MREGVWLISTVLNRYVYLVSDLSNDLFKTSYDVRRERRLARVAASRRARGAVPFERHECAGQFLATSQRGLQSFGFFLEELLLAHDLLHLGAQQTLHALLQTWEPHFQVSHGFAGRKSNVVGL